MNVTELTKGKMTDYKPYSFRKKRIWGVFKTNVLVYEQDDLSIQLPLEDSCAERIVELLNCAFSEGYLYHSMTHKCDENWRGEKLITNRVSKQR